MELRALFRDEDAVSSVLGVVLMVAVTIVLAAVIGTFVLGIGEDLTDPSPNVNFDYSADVGNGTDPSSVVILHGGGDDFEKLDVEVTVGGDTAYVGGQAVGNYSATRDWNQLVDAGARLELEDNGWDVESGDTVRIYWSDGSQASIIGEHRIE